MNRKKVIMMIVSASVLPLVGCSNNINTDELVSVEDLKIKDISDAYDGENLILFKNELTYSPDIVDKYNKLGLVSYKVTSFNEETLQYNVDFTIKNTSNEKLSNIIARLTIFGEYGGVSTENLEIESLDANEETTQTLQLYLPDLTDISVEYSEGDVDYKKAIKSALNDKAFYGDFTYTYSNDLSEDLMINTALDFDGIVKHSYLEISNEMEKDDFENNKTSHVENGSYLNLVNPENEKHFNDIVVENLEVKINDSFDFEIITKFKNNGDKEIKNFKFDPFLNIFGIDISIFSEDELEEINVYSNKTIKPGEEFEISATIYGSFINLNPVLIDELKEVKGFDIASSKETIVNLIENRLISVGYIYSYNNGEFENLTSAKYSNTGKLQEFSSGEYLISDFKMDE